MLRPEFVAFEMRTLYIVHTYFSADPIYHDIYRDAYYRRFGTNLDLSPEVLIEHCEALKQDLERLYYHFYSDKLTEQQIIDALDKTIAELEGE